MFNGFLNYNEYPDHCRVYLSEDIVRTHKRDVKALEKLQAKQLTLQNQFKTIRRHFEKPGKGTLQVGVVLKTNGTALSNNGISIY